VVLLGNSDAKTMIIARRACGFMVPRGFMLSRMAVRPRISEAFGDFCTTHAMMIAGDRRELARVTAHPVRRQIGVVEVSEFTAFVFDEDDAHYADQDETYVIVRDEGGQIVEPAPFPTVRCVFVRDDGAHIGFER